MNQNKILGLYFGLSCLRDSYIHGIITIYDIFRTYIYVSIPAILHLDQAQELYDKFLVLQNSPNSKFDDLFLLTVASRASIEVEKLYLPRMKKSVENKNVITQMYIKEIRNRLIQLKLNLKRKELSLMICYFCYFEK